MSKIQAVFADLKKTGKKGLIPFITAGDPDPASTVEFMHALVRGGANILELGIPFSDPMADGPVIQRSSERALSQGVTLRHCLEPAQTLLRDMGIAPNASPPSIRKTPRITAAMRAHPGAEIYSQNSAMATIEETNGPDPPANR